MKKYEWKQALDVAPVMQHLNHPHFPDLIAIAKLNLALENLRDAFNDPAKAEELKRSLQQQLQDINLTAPIFQQDLALKDFVVHLKSNPQKIIVFFKNDKTRPQCKPEEAKQYRVSVFDFVRPYIAFIRDTHYQK